MNKITSVKLEQKFSRVATRTLSTSSLRTESISIASNFMKYLSESILYRWFLVALLTFLVFPANFTKGKPHVTWLSWLFPKVLTLTDSHNIRINLNIYDAVWSPILLIQIHKSIVYAREVVNLIFVFPVENSAIHGVAKLTVRMRKVMVVV